MKLLSCHIENFGKISNFDYIFSEGLNSINQPNGWGKTTFACFLKAMFYGMEKRGRSKPYEAERSRFAPWQGGVYGGSLIFEHNGKTYRILRTFAQTPEGDRFELVDVKTGAISRDFSVRVGEELFGVGSDTFTMTTFFPQGDLEADINDEVRAFLTGADGLNADLAAYEKANANLDKKLKNLKAQSPSVMQIRTCQEEQEKQKARLSELEENKAVIQEGLSLRKAQLEQIKPLKRSDKNLPAKLAEEMVAKKTELKRVESIQQKRASKRKGLTVASAILAAICVAMIVVLALFHQSLVICAISAALLGGGVCAMIVLAVLSAKLKGDGKILKQKEELDQQIADIATQLERLSDESGEMLIFEEKAKLQREIAVLEEQAKTVEKEIGFVLEKLDDLQLEEENLRSLKEACESKIMTIMNVKAFMLKAKQNISERFVEPMQAKLVEILKRLSSENLNPHVDFDLNLKIDTQTGLKERQYLSQGRRDLLAVCKRFALIESVFKKTLPFIVLDDPFVNLDEKTMKNMHDLLQELGRSYQIIYLTCHSARV